MGILEKEILSRDHGKSHDLPYKHYGSYSLEIAEKIDTLSAINESRIIRKLHIEGLVHVIMTMQIKECKNFRKENDFFNELSVNDIKTIYTVAEYIEHHLAKHITIKNLVTVSGLSPHKLQLGFKLLYSKSIKDYIKTSKLKLSKELIKTTNLTIAEVVYTIGYNSRSYFSKIFFEEYHITPMAYKEQLKTVGFKNR